MRTNSPRDTCVAAPKTSHLTGQYLQSHKIRDFEHLVKVVKTFQLTMHKLHALTHIKQNISKLRHSFAERESHTCQESTKLRRILLQPKACEHPPPLQIPAIRWLPSSSIWSDPPNQGKRTQLSFSVNLIFLELHSWAASLSWPREKTFSL